VITIPRRPLDIGTYGGNRVTHAVVGVDNAAHRRAQQALRTDKAEQATWAGRQGLLATWACEECYRNLMRAAIHQDFDLDG
jgi:hypothetical protein